MYSMEFDRTARADARRRREAARERVQALLEEQRRRDELDQRWLFVTGRRPSRGNWHSNRAETRSPLDA